MEEQGTGIILARATELRLKIRNHVNTATTTSPAIPSDCSADSENGVAAYNGAASIRTEADEIGETDENDEAVRLLNICDALESLENQLAFLQDLQHRQRYEKEAALSEIELSRKILLDKLKEYEGEDLEVIHEASAFAGETVQQNNDLLLPPYPSHPPHSPSLDNGFFLHFPFRRNSRSSRRTSTAINEPMKKLPTSARENSTGPRNSMNRFGSFMIAAAKSVLTIVGVVSILHLSGLGPKSGRKVGPFKVLSLFTQSKAEENRSQNECPPGKVLVMEDGETRCVVKERIEVPFSSVLAKPDVNYGCG